MAKQLFHDIVPPDKKSIKKIPIPERSREARERVSAREAVREPIRERPVARPVTREAPRTRRAEPVEEEEPKVVRAPRTRTVRRKKAPIIFTLLALVVLGALVFVFIPKATGANITLTPRGQNVSVNSTFTATKDPNADLPYQVATEEKDGKLTIPANGQETVDVKASGVIRIFNDYSSDPQKLVINTRFETPSGLIFRITQPVTIPGKSGSTPGSIDAAITADKSGADYNVGLSDFTIPGFKDDPKYTKIFARSKSTIGGGFTGSRSKVDGDQVTAAREKIHAELQASLIRQMQQNTPAEYVFPQSAYFIEYQSLPDNPVENGVQLTERATFHGIMFARKNLATAIATKVSGADAAANQGDLLGTDNLVFSTKTNTTASSTAVWNSSSFPFSLNGTTTLISSIDTDKLKGELVGKPRKSLSAVLEGYPGVAKAQVIMRPFWKQSFPENPTEITIDVTKTAVSP